MHSIYPWQKQQWQYLLNCKNSGKLPHAILVHGIEGLGKRHFARCFAEILLCKQDLAHACNKCYSCQLLNSNNHPDLFIITPEDSSKVIKIDQIRDLTSELNNTSQQGGSKVAIIEQAELLNVAAANALLKSLEEPAAGVYIILVTSCPRLLPATVRSRCQSITMKTLSLAENQEWLKQELPNVDSKLALLLTANAPLSALALLKNNELPKRQEFFQNLYDLYNKKISSVQMAEQCLDWDLRALIVIFMQLVGDLVKMKFAAASESIINQDQFRELSQFADKINLYNLFNYQKQLLECHSYLNKNINLNQQLVVENLIISWMQLYAKS